MGTNPCLSGILLLSERETAAAASLTSILVNCSLTPAHHDRRRSDISISRKHKYEQHEFRIRIQCSYHRGDNHPGDQQRWPVQSLSRCDSSTKNVLRETHKLLKSAESSDILRQATATAAFHNSKERFDPPKCHPNTRLAVLTKIMKWIKWEGDLNSFIIWVYGPAGAGKSAITQTIAEMCEREMILLASFFFSRNDPSRSNVNSLIATLAYQITLNLPDVRDAILSAIEHDPLIFSKSFAVQVETLIVAPLQPLAEAGFFNDFSSRRLVIIDGIDECSDPRVQQNILEVLANAQRHRLPLVFLIASRPEQHISLTFNTGLLLDITSFLALDDSYLPDKDIELFLTDKFQEIKSTHRLRAYIPSQWPLSDVLEQLVRKSSGQFIYASTVIRYISSIRHKPVDRLDIILGLRPPQRDLPFAELDALYTHILSGVEDTECVLEILSVVFFCKHPCPIHEWNLIPPIIEKFLCLQPGDIELYLGELNSLVNVDPDNNIRVLHASLTDFFVDPTRSKTFWINRQARHTAFARRCVQVFQIPGNPYSSL